MDTTIRYDWGARERIKTIEDPVPLELLDEVLKLELPAAQKIAVMAFRQNGNQPMSLTRMQEISGKPRVSIDLLQMVLRKSGIPLAFKFTTWHGRHQDREYKFFSVSPPRSGKIKSSPQGVSSMRFKFELQVFQDGELDEVLETPLNEFRDATDLAEALASFAFTQSGTGRLPGKEARRYWEQEYGKQNFLRPIDERVSPHFNLDHLEQLAAQVNARNYESANAITRGSAGIALPPARQGYSGRTHLVISKVIPVAA